MAVARAAGADATDVYFEAHGAPGPRPPVLLITGLASDAHAWEPQIPAFAADRQVLALDNRGVGRSGKPDGPYTTAQMAGDVVAVLDAADAKAAHVVGISLGGMIAQEVALRHPARVRSLALLATFASADAAVQRAASDGVAIATPRGGQTSLAEVLLALGRGDANADLFSLFAHLSKALFSPAYLSRERLYIQSFFLRSLQYGFSPAGLLGQIRAVMTHEAEERLAALRAPTLVVLGQDDALVPPALTRALARGIPGSRLEEIRGGTHALNFEFAENVNKLLVEWFFTNDEGEYVPA